MKLGLSGQVVNPGIRFRQVHDSTLEIIEESLAFTVSRIRISIRGCGLRWCLHAPQRSPGGC